MLVSWNTTQACNLKCLHCYREAGAKNPGELTCSEGKQLIREIKAAGFHVLVFSGGEPLLRPDLYELIAYARSQGLRPVCGTNGTLITPEVARRLKEAGTAVAGISLDSTDPAKHDRFRGVPGAWQAAREGMENCRAAGLPFQIHTTVFPWNYDEVEALTDLALELGARGHHVFFFVPTGRGRRQLPVITPEKTEDLLKRLLKRQTGLPLEVKPTCAPQFVRIAKQLHLPTRFKRGCLAGIAYCIIGPTGDVYPCPYMDLRVDNVRRLPFNEIWRNNRIFQKLREQRYGGYCDICSYRHLCGGCRARALEDGDYLGEDPLCLYKDDQERKLARLAEQLLVRVQRGLPVTSRPYLALARELGVREGEVLQAMRWLKGKGVVRRLGAIFDARKLGYQGTLCAVKVPPERVDEVAAAINAYPGVTHNYLREHEYNLWFTLTGTSAEEVRGTIAEIQQRIALEVVSFPAREVFKIAVNFSEEELYGALAERTGCN